MASLIAKTPCAGILPLKIGQLRLEEPAPAPITSIAPFSGKDRAVASALKALGLGWPAPDRAVTGAAGACLWSGRGQAFLLGVAPEGMAGIAALTDQSDGWARIALEGPGAEAVLARLVALDIGAAAFPAGSTARTGLGHMMALLWRSAPERFEIFVFRSMARTAVHELETAMRACAARAVVDHG
ncbi:MAG: sarcosine oxidase subunit gamma [Defluviimonas sp.]|uniref:sarcosine oxidase subunit gamma n=1 Tax=Albidovulum sp. TaxID=1872424 RepID=UPI001D876AA5|nr:sarcosine oxidase subunit gamma [Paracoccaceae bacterium]MCC0063630.1 sarcosine oxidase subunit gamma [Defluviimonas sp.]